MIKNEVQYKVTQKLLANFRVTLGKLRKRALPDTPRWLYNEQLKTVEGNIKRLEAQTKEYRELKLGKKRLPNLAFLHNVPELLVKYRIASKMSQRELAYKLGLHEQQIQKYESTNYEGASLATIYRIADMLESVSSDRQK